MSIDVFNAVAKSVCNPVISPASMCCTPFCIVCFFNLRSAECVCSYYGLRVCYKQTNKIKIKKYLCGLLRCQKNLRLSESFYIADKTGALRSNWKRFQTNTLVVPFKERALRSAGNTKSFIKIIVSEVSQAVACRSLVMAGVTAWLYAPLPTSGV